MRGKPDSPPPMFFAIHVEDRIRGDHPLRPIKRMVDEERHETANAKTNQ